jgi:uncharacterized protein with GYD domain
MFKPMLEVEFSGVLDMEKSMQGKSMQKYLLLIKLSPSKAENFYNALMKISEKPSEGVRLNGSYNVFGIWDFAVWFEANSNDEAVHFVGENIRAIDGVIETVTMPTTPIKEYRM